MSVMFLVNRHPRAKASPLSLEARALAFVSKDRRPGWWPFILRGSLRERLRMTGLHRDLIGDILSLIAARFTSHASASATEFKRSFAAA
ncbi:hypothetical protein [Bradyrhizobium sp. USDA 4506]